MLGKTIEKIKSFFRKNQPQKIEVLDYGFIRIIPDGCSGCDLLIEQAARVSYGKGTRKKRDSEKLIRYLMKNHHHSPFEMATLTFHVKCPIFVARQWFRHRTGSFNEISGRYSELPTEFYLPKTLRGQSTKNKQSSEGVINSNHDELIKNLEMSCLMSFKAYENLLENGVSRELARIVLPLGTYTEFYWKTDFRNLLHFLELRLAPNAQEEIRVYAEAILDLIPETLDMSIQAWNVSRETVSK